MLLAFKSLSHWYIWALFWKYRFGCWAATTTFFLIRNSLVGLSGSKVCSSLTISVWSGFSLLTPDERVKSSDVNIFFSFRIDESEGLVKISGLWGVTRLSGLWLSSWVSSQLNIFIFSGTHNLFLSHSWLVGGELGESSVTLLTLAGWLKYMRSSSVSDFTFYFYNFFVISNSFIVTYFLEMICGDSSTSYSRMRYVVISCEPLFS